MNSNSQQVEVQDESKKEEDIIKGGNDRVGFLKVNSNKQEHLVHDNASFKLKDRKSTMFKKIRGRDHSNTQKSELKNEEQSQLEYISALEANTEGCDNIGNEDNDDSDDESDVDDYLRMMKLG